VCNVCNIYFMDNANTNPVSHVDFDDEPADRCTEPTGHDWVINEESDRCYCCFCGADGDA
jgi:hypothetical protein